MNPLIAPEGENRDSYQVLNTLFSPSLPNDKRLYHYTDAGGLLGMAQYQELWMTSLHYQNDSQEYYYAFNLLKQIIKDEYPDLLTEEQLQKIGNNMSATFTFSLTEERDSLSQWRGYCPKGGYAISFDKTQLDNVIARDHLRIARCEYDKDRQREFLINNVIKITPEEYKRINDEADLMQSSRPGFGHIVTYLMSYGFTEYMGLLAPIFKHPSFHHEKEWRLIRNYSGAYSSRTTLSGLMGDIRYQNLAGLSVRVSNNRIVPYQKYSLKFQGKIMSFDEVVVGPTAHKALALDACRVLLNAYEGERYHQAQVGSSEIPYVNW